MILRPTGFGGHTVRLALMIMAVIVAGCAARPPAPPITAERHAANVASAERAGYKVVSIGDRTLFCPTASPTGSHMAPSCMTETEWEAQLGGRHGMSSAARFSTQPPGPGANAGH